MSAINIQSLNRLRVFLNILIENCHVGRPQGALAVASQAREQYQEITNVHKTLSQLKAAQKILLDGLAKTIPDDTKLQKKLDEADNEIAALDAQLGHTQNGLFEALTAKLATQMGQTTF
jgi:septal ring factor EnvC (AmiA/AmiB activator)